MKKYLKYLILISICVLAYAPAHAGMNVMMASGNSGDGDAPASAWIAVGTYTGDGEATQAIDGVGFQPDLVIIHSNVNEYAVWATDQMDSQEGLLGASTAGALSDLIESFDTDGFTVGTSNRVNENLSEYYYIAFIDRGDDNFTVGKYIGASGDDRPITGVGFQPNFVLLQAEDNTRAEMKVSGVDSGESWTVDCSAFHTDYIQSFDSDGFTVGDNDGVNPDAGGDVFWAAWKNVTDLVKVGTYEGDGAEDRNITDPGFTPDKVFIRKDATGCDIEKSIDTDGTDTTNLWNTTVAIDNQIQDIITNGFQVGTGGYANTSGVDYFYIVFKEGP